MSNSEVGNYQNQTNTLTVAIEPTVSWDKSIYSWLTTYTLTLRSTVPGTIWNGHPTLHFLNLQSPNHSNSWIIRESH